MSSLQGIHNGYALSYFDKIVAKINVPPISVRTNFFRLLSVSQHVGLGLRESLICIAQSETNKVMKMVIEDMIMQVNTGKDLGNTMTKYPYIFDISQIELIKAAQIMGNLPQILKEVANEMENYQQIESKIKGALIYPATLILFTIIAVMILLIKVVPTIVSLYPSSDQLPNLTKLTLVFSDFIQNRWFAICLFGIGSVVIYNILYSYFLPFKVLIDGFVLKIPVMKDTIRTFYMYRFSKLLGDFLHAGVDPIMSLSQIANIFPNFFYKTKVLDIKNDLSAGFTFADSIEGSDLFDPILVQIVAVGESTGNLGEILQAMSMFYKDQVMVRISTLMGLIEPMLMAFIAIIIGGIVASIFLPLADLVNVLGG